MLPSETSYPPPDERDQEIFEATVPEDHYLRRVKDLVDFERFRPILAEAYCNDQGRPAIEPLLLLKLEFLQYQYNFSDRDVMTHSCSNMAYRYFLNLSLHSSLPHHTLLTYFRRRLGTKRHQQIFDAMVAQARERGLVQDRLRLKDATHVLANIAIPTTIGLVGQTRERLLRSLEAWAPDEVSRQRERAEQIRQRTQDLSGEERLVERVVHLRELVAWAEDVYKQNHFRTALPVQHQQLQEVLELALKVLDDRFARATCAGCPLQPRCVPKLPQATGRTVFKSDYEKDMLAARAKAQTPEYAKVRREHPAVERKIGELVRRHGARRARYRKKKRVLLQQLVTGFVVNIKRMVKLLVDPGARGRGILRAAGMASG